MSCLRCGKCCYFLDGDGIKRKCPHLVILPSKKTLCRVYNTRLGREIGVGFYCNPREALGDIKGCPYNGKKA